MVELMELLKSLRGQEEDGKHQWDHPNQGIFFTKASLSIANE
jgi:hypothetical protein